MEVMATMLKVRYPESMTLRLSRETVIVLDDIAADFGGISRRASIEILARFARRVKDSSAVRYADLFVADAIPEPVNRNGHKKSKGKFGSAE
jgi:hypothetical protein